MIVILELCQWKQFIPVILSLVDKEVEILFQLLVDLLHLSVDLLHLSVALWMVGHSGSQLYAKEVVELLFWNPSRPWC